MAFLPIQYLFSLNHDYLNLNSLGTHKILSIFVVISWSISPVDLFIKTDSEYFSSFVKTIFYAVCMNKLKTKISRENSIYVLRPLLKISKENLIYISNKTFKFFINDPTNNDEFFLRIRIRKLIKELNESGLNLKKLKTTLDNLSKSNIALEFYVKKNSGNASMSKSEFFIISLIWA